MKATLRRLKAAVTTLRDYTYDGLRFYQHSQSGLRTLNDKQLVGRMFAKAHSIEKGLALPDVRLGFGKDALVELGLRLHEFEARGLPLDHPAYLKGRAAISAYIQHHRKLGTEIDPQLSFLRAFELDNILPQAGGILALTKQQLREAASANFLNFSRSRHSIRSFSEEPVSLYLLQRAVEIAQSAPSVCNRQGARVHIIENENARQSALRIQGGNRGFGERTPALLVVTESLSIFRDSKERNQAFVDGGLFSMSLLYALHFLGLGACPLNWSAEAQKDLALRRVLAIPEEEAIIMLVAVGGLRDEFAVAASPRRNLTEIIRIV